MSAPSPAPAPAPAAGSPGTQLEVHQSQQPAIAAVDHLLQDIKQAQRSAELALSVGQLDATTQDSQRFQAKLQKEGRALWKFRAALADQREQVEVTNAQLRDQVQQAKLKYASKNAIKLQLEEHNGKLLAERRQEEQRLKQLQMKARDAKHAHLQTSAEVLSLIEGCCVYGRPVTPLLNKFEGAIASRIATQQTPLMAEVWSQAQDTLQDKQVTQDSAIDLNRARLEQTSAALRSKIESAADEVQRLLALVDELTRAVRAYYYQLMELVETITADFECTNCQQPQDIGDYMEWGAVQLTPVRTDVGIRDEPSEASGAIDQTSSQSPLDTDTQQHPTTSQSQTDELEPVPPAGFNLFDAVGDV